MKELHKAVCVACLIGTALAGSAASASGQNAWLIVNEDNDHYFKNPTELMTEKDLNAYIDYTCRGKVTHFFMCPSGQRASFDSKTWEPIWKGMDESDHGNAVSNIWCVNAKLLRDRRIDPYAVWTKRCRERGVSPWMTLRMNDAHFMLAITNYFRNTTFCRTRRDLWICPDTKGGWADCSLDYAKKDTRDYMMAHLKEVVERYDTDGIELDWMRFGENLRRGHEVDDAHCLTEFMREVRRFLDGVGVKRGRRISLGIRACHDPNLALSRQGMDVAAWAKDGLVDLVVPTSMYFADAGIAVRRWVDLIAQANPRVRVIPCIDYCYLKNGRREWMKMANFRWVADRFYRAGAQGIYLFNLPYIGKYHTDGACVTVDVAGEVFEEGLGPESVREGTQEPIPVWHDFPRDLTAWGGLAPLPAVSVGGKALRVEPMRCSAMPVNIRWPGHQREKNQTEICFFARFDLAAPVEVVVTAPRAFTNAAVRPVSKKIAVTREGDKVRFTLAKPGAYSVEFDGRHENLMLFADEPKDYSDIDRKAANVRYYGPGEHDVGLITLRAGETLFIDEGAVVYGRIEARDAPGIRICGTGILDASRVKEVPKAIDPKLAEEQRKKGWAITNVKRFNTIFPQFCDNVRIEGITIRDSQIYAIRPVCCDNLTIENVKILGSWRYNSDGIDMHNCRHVLIRDCFIRTYDDSICVKGFDYCLPESEMTHNGVVHDIFEDVLVERCTIWNDWGRALEIGAETRAREIRNVTFRDCDILAYHAVALDVQNCDQAHVHDIRFENIRVACDPDAPKTVYSASAKDFDPASRCAPAPLAACVIHYIPEYSKAGAENRGRTTDIVFRDIDVYGPTLPGGSLRGFDKDHRVERVTFDRIRLNGKDVTDEFCRKVSRNEFALADSAASPTVVRFRRPIGVCAVCERPETADIVLDSR